VAVRYAGRRARGIGPLRRVRVGLCPSPVVVSREVVEFGFAVFGVAVMTETAIV
jgi:hypothetical protein